MRGNRRIALLAVIAVITAGVALGAGRVWSRLDDLTWGDYQLRSGVVRLERGPQVVSVAGPGRPGGPDARAVQDVTVVGPDGAAVPLTRPAHETLQRHGYGYRSVAAFDAAESGEYVVTVAGAADDEILVAPSAGRIAHWLWATVAAAVSAAAALVLLAVTVVRELGRRHRSQPGRPPL